MGVSPESREFDVAISGVDPAAYGCEYARLLSAILSAVGEFIPLIGQSDEIKLTISIKP